MKPNNPFLISGYHSPAYFCDRQRETSTIIDALHNGRNITLIAPRRMGKTGLIKHVFCNLKEQQSDIVTLYMDIYSTQNLGDFVRLLANTVLGQLDSAPQKALSRINKFIRSCRPVITLDEYTGMPKITVDISPSEEQNTLKEIFEYVASSDKRCYIAIDEFQQITEYPEKGVEALLRSYIQFVPNVNFIFAGSKQHVMQQMFTSSKKPFYQSTQLLTIEAINREEYSIFAIDLFAKNKTALPQSVFDEIYTKLSGHTWYMQCLLNRLYSYNHDVDNNLVRYAMEQIISEASYAYADLLKSYSAGHVRLLKAIAREGCVKEILSGEFIKKHNLRAASSVSSALKKLINNELIYQSSDGYIVYDRFMAEWLRRMPF
jgi:AAA+ ATPase superfamily predicted ATPase